MDTTSTALVPVPLSAPASTTKRDFAEPQQQQERPGRQLRFTLPTGDTRTATDTDLTLDNPLLKQLKPRRIATVSLRTGEELRVSVNEDTEPTTDMYDSPHIYDSGDFPPEELATSMTHEMASMRRFDVFVEVPLSSLPPDVLALPSPLDGCTGGRAIPFARDVSAVA